MKCFNCGNDDPKSMWDEGDTFYCSRCCHRTRVSDGKDDVVLCPVCHHMRDRKAFYCMWCNSPWGSSDTFDKEIYKLVNEFEKSVGSDNIRYYKLKGRRK